MNWSVADHIRGLESSPSRDRRVGIGTLTDDGTRNLGSLSELWLGTDKDAGCCTQGTLQWGTRPDGFIDAYTNLPDGTTTTGVLLFARTDAQIAAEPLMRLAWNDVTTNKQTYIWFAFALKGQLPISCAAPHPAKRWWPHR